MIEFIPIILKSSVCLTAFYILFRYTLKKETFFTLNRMLLLSLVVLSIAIPFLHFPWPVNNEIQINLFPTEKPIAIPEYNDIAFDVITTPTNNATVSTQTSISYQQVLIYTYVLGFVISLILLLFNIGKLLFWLSRSKIYKKDGYKLALVKQMVSPMSFGKFIIMSNHDYRENKDEILKHEIIHIKFKHTFDLLLMELVKIIHWFNPFIYALVKDLKELQEYQVDREVINSGINSKAYQLLMIKKCVGTERYALANSFNHCQIKNRIVMMNNQKTRKSKSWKVAIFLPVAALMLMAFGSKRDEVPINDVSTSTNAIDQVDKAWELKDFKTITSEELKSRKEHDFFNGIKWINVLIDKSSRIMMDGKVTPLADVGSNTAQMIQSDIKRYQNNNGNDGKSILSFIVFIRKDIAANKADFNGLINSIANEFISARNTLSSIKYNLDYESISSSEKEIINAMIPMNVYIVNPPKEIKGNAGRPPPPSTLRIKKDGVYLGNKYTLDELKKLIEFNTSDGSKMRFIIKVDDGVEESKVNEVKKVLEHSEIVRIENVKPSSKKTTLNIDQNEKNLTVRLEILEDHFILNGKKVTPENIETELRNLYKGSKDPYSSSVSSSSKSSKELTKQFSEILTKLGKENNWPPNPEKEIITEINQKTY